MHKHDVKGVLFDLDGTLADTAPDLVHALNLSLNDSGFSAQPLDKMRHAASHGSLFLVKTAIPEADETTQMSVQQGLLRHYVQVNGTYSRLFDGLAELLTLLDQQSIPYGVVTNKPARFARPLVDKLGLTANLKAMISGDSTNARIRRATPRPSPSGQNVLSPPIVTLLVRSLPHHQSETASLGGCRFPLAGICPAQTHQIQRTRP